MSVVLPFAPPRAHKSSPPKQPPLSKEEFAALPREILEHVSEVAASRLSEVVSFKVAPPRTANARGECEDRETRQRAWRAAEYTMSFWQVLRRLGHAASIAWDHAGLDAAKPYAGLDKGHALLDYCRAAELALLLTAAPSAAALNEKKRMRNHCWHSAIVEQNHNRIDALIVHDEAWLKANAPIRRSRKAVQE